MFRLMKSSTFSFRRIKTSLLPRYQNTLAPNLSNLANNNAAANTAASIAKEGDTIYGIKNPVKSLINTTNDPCLQAGLRREMMPKHVAAILDGNRRWAKVHGKELDYSLFYQGYAALADLCLKWEIPVLSCFIFSSENWKRPKEAIDMLFKHFRSHLEENLHMFTRKGIKVSIIGDKRMLPKPLKDVIYQVEEATSNNKKLDLLFATNYGGRWDVIQALKNISYKAKSGVVQVEDVDEALIDKHLSTKNSCFPDPDLLIRTGGDHRVSNFLMWQMYHTEFHFTDVYGSDFGEDEFIKALHFFENSDRRFGL